MRLYIEDLNKAVSQTPSTGTDTKDESQSIVSDKRSYTTNPVGVMGGGGSVSYDDPDSGKDWKHDKDSSVENALEEERQKRNKEAQDRNLVPTEEEVSMTKSLDESANDMIKSLNNKFSAELNRYRLSDSERSFLKSELGLSEDDIRKGNISVGPKERAKFCNWLQDQFEKSLEALRS